MIFRFYMIQRIQTLCLLLAAIALGVQFISPYFTVPIGIDSARVPDLVDGMYNIFDRPWLIYMTSFAALMVIIAIFMFRNRVIQSRFTSVGIFTASVLTVYMGAQFFPIANVAGDLMEQLSYRPGFFMPFLSALLMWLANRAIRRDHMMIRSAERLR